MESEVFEHLIDLAKAGRYEDKIRKELILAAEATDVNDQACLLRGAVVDYTILGRLVEARELIDQVLRLNISELGIRLDAEFSNAVLLMQEGKTEDGVSAFAALIHLQGEALKQPELRYLYEEIQIRRALAVVNLKRFDEALPILKEAVSFSFDNAEDEQEIHFALGACLFEKDAASAREAFDRVIGFGLKNPTEERARYRVALISFRDRGFAQARSQLETILRDFPAEGAAVPRNYVYEQLSAIYRHMGETKLAKHYKDLARK